MTEQMIRQWYDEEEDFIATLFTHLGVAKRYEYALDEEAIVDLAWETEQVVLTIVNGECTHIMLENEHRINLR